MAPNIDVAPAVTEHTIRTKDVPAASAKQPQLLKQPLKYSGALDGYRKFQVTPAIGVEYPELQLSDIVQDDAKIRDLAITSESN